VEIYGNDKNKAKSQRAKCNRIAKWHKVVGEMAPGGMARYRFLL
jgi:hypothetical protein